MSTLVQDLRYALRMMAASPGYTAIALLALALGIGPNAVIFSVVNAFLLRSLPFHEPDHIVALLTKAPPGNVLNRWSVSYPDFIDWSSHNHVFTRSAAFNAGEDFNLSGTERPERVEGAEVTHGFFEVFGIRPVLGRSFRAAEDRPGAPKVVILSHGLWQRLFGGDPAILGRSLQLDGEPHTVVGVVPAGQEAPAGCELWVPLAQTLEEDDRGSHFLTGVARLKPGVTLEQARADLAAIAQRLALEHPKTNKGVGVVVLPVHELLVEDARPALLVLQCGVGFVLLIACANVANLLLARATTRHRELAIRAALGAGRWRILRQLLTESVLLALLGGVFGLLLAVWGIRVLTASLPSDYARYFRIELDPTVLAFTLALAGLTGVIFGLAPALRALRSNLQEGLKEGGTAATAGSSRQRFRSFLVVAEIALALVLLIGAGLMIKAFWRLQQVPSGIRAENVLSFRLSLPEIKYPEVPQIADFYQQLTERIETIPGVRSAAAVLILPLSGSGGWDSSFSVEGQPPPAENDLPLSNYQVITPRFFETLGIPLIRGRAFTPHDQLEAPGVVIVNQTVAQRFWPQQDPIGKRLKLGRPESEQPWLTVVGVVGDVRHRGLDREVRLDLYFPVAQKAIHGMCVVVKTAVNPSALVGAVRREARGLDPDQPIYDLATMEQVISESVYLPRLAAWLLGIFAAVALLLAAVGIYGVMTYAVSQRTQEIGIRMALGAARGDVLRLVIGQGMTLALTGLVIGILLAWAVTRLMASLLHGVSATDPVTYIALPLGLAVIALLSIYLPARRAMAVDPLIALRYE